MSTSNLTVLTSSHKIIAAKKRAKREQIKEIVFDDEARRDFLTGFHKRKLQKKEAAKKKALEREKQERLEARREKRKLLAERAAQNAAETERAYGAHSEGQDESDQEWSGISAEGISNKGKGKEIEEEYEMEEQVATVTVVEDFDPAEIIHGPQESRPESLKSQNAHSSTLPRTQPKIKSRDTLRSQPLVAKSKLVKKAKDIKYQTNAARKSERMKQRRRRTEKAERAGGKLSRKSGDGRRKRK
ncbi:uncharacterized protein FIBRA_07219 [Fibroporia radiculosa]|uniref:Ribosomal RNA-processing protein 17 n=1 Tax=Fibroporia radiculosa TaxID=599839 RepID=J4GUJ3_9APHY|nr:uncharacterized protein FIBRA_07219 [Fibroporia radiculosa]CCM05020.1 predicted protein [Fibroporia radiculosa]